MIFLICDYIFSDGICVIIFHLNGGSKDINYLWWKLGRKYIQLWFIKDFFEHPTLTYEVLLVIMHEIVGIDLNSYVYDLRSLLNI